MTREQLKLEECRALISCARDFLARHSLSPENGKGLPTQGEPCSLRLPDWLKPDSLLIFSLKMFPGCYRMTKAGRFIPSSVHFGSWGTMWNGRCLTAKILGSHSQGGGCTLSDILMEDVPEKYFLSRKQTERLLYSAYPGARENGSMTQSVKGAELHIDIRRRRHGWEDRAV